MIFGRKGEEGNELESPPFGRVPLNKVGAPTYPYDIFQSGAELNLNIEMKDQRPNNERSCMAYDERYLYAIPNPASHTSWQNSN
jgi:hypothetical protein